MARRYCIDLASLGHTLTLNKSETSRHRHNLNGSVCCQSGNEACIRHFIQIQRSVLDIGPAGQPSWMSGVRVGESADRTHMAGSTAHLRCGRYVITAHYALRSRVQFTQSASTRVNVQYCTVAVVVVLEPSENVNYVHYLQ